MLLRKQGVGRVATPGDLKNGKYAVLASTEAHRAVQSYVHARQDKDARACRGSSILDAPQHDGKSQPTDWLRKQQLLRMCCCSVLMRSPIPLIAPLQIQCTLKSSASPPRFIAASSMIRTYKSTKWTPPVSYERFAMMARLICSMPQP